jgi:hypothetical protein
VNDLLATVGTAACDDLSVFLLSYGSHVNDLLATVRTAACDDLYSA